MHKVECPLRVCLLGPRQGLAHRGAPPSGASGPPIADLQSRVAIQPIHALVIDDQPRLAQRQIGHQRLQAAVFLLKLLQAPHLVDVHAAVFGFPTVVSALADTVGPTDLSHLASRLDLVEDADNLLLGKPRLFHLNLLAVAALPRVPEDSHAGWFGFWVMVSKSSMRVKRKRAE
jgi:hypothetical protein